MTNGLIDAVQTGLVWDAQNPAFTEPEAAAFNARLLQLLSAQIKRKTQGDSTSLRVEEAEELLASIRFTLTYHAHAYALPVQALLTTNADALFAQAQRTVLRALEQAKQLYGYACRTVRTLESRSLRDTLQGIAVFFARYDARLYAHQMPADIDYQLCQPVPETLAGVAYLIAYLQRLLLENELISRMDEAREVALLRRVHPNYGELLLNLYEPIAANVVGLRLSGGGETLLEMTRMQGERVQATLAGVSREAALTMLSDAAQSAYHKLSLTDSAGAAYLAQTARALYPRLMASPESAAGVFNVCNSR